MHPPIPRPTNLSASIGMGISISAVFTMVSGTITAILLSELASGSFYRVVSVLRLQNRVALGLTVLGLILSLVAIILGIIGWKAARQHGQGRIASAIALTAGSIVGIVELIGLAYIVSLALSGRLII